MYYEKRVNEDIKNVFLAQDYYSKTPYLDKTLELNLKAADHSYQMFDYFGAKKYFSTSLEILKKSDFKSKINFEISEIKYNLANSLLHLGENKDSFDIFTEITKNKDKSYQNFLLKSHSKLGDIINKNSEYKNSAHHFDICLNQLKSNHSKSDIISFFQLGWELIKFPFIKYQESGNNSRDYLFSIDVLNKQAYALYFTDVFRCTVLGIVAINKGKKRMETPEACISASQGALVLYNLGFKNWSFNATKNSLYYGSKIKQPDANCYTEVISALLFTMDGKWNDAFNISDNAIKKTQNYGLVWENVFAHEYACYSLYKQGKFKELLKYSTIYKEKAEKGTDIHFLLKARTTHLLAQAMNNRAYQKMDTSELEAYVQKHKDDILIKLISGSRLIHALQLNGDFKKAYDLGIKLLDGVNLSIFIQDCAVELFLLHIESIYKLVDIGEFKKNGKEFKSIKKFFWLCVAKCLIFQNYRPATYRVIGIYFNYFKFNWISKILLNKSIKFAYAKSMRYELAKSEKALSDFYSSKKDKKLSKLHFKKSIELFKECSANAELSLLSQKFDDPTQLPTDPKQLEADSKGFSNIHNLNEIRVQEIYNLNNSINDFSNIDNLLKQTLSALIKASAADNGLINIVVNGKSYKQHFKEENSNNLSKQFNKDLESQIVKEKKPIIVEKNNKFNIQLNENCIGIYCYPIFTKNLSFGYLALESKNSGIFSSNMEKICKILSSQLCLLLKSYIVLDKYKRKSEALDSIVKDQENKIKRKNIELRDLHFELIKSENSRRTLIQTTVDDIETHNNIISEEFENLQGEEKGTANRNFNLILCHSVSNDIAELALNLNDLNKMDEGRIRLNKALIDKSEIIDLINICSVNPMFDEKHITISSIFDSPDFGINWDVHYLKRVFQNLFNNASKYTPKGGKVKIKFEMDDSSFIFSLFNSGTKISKEAQELVFKKYERLENNLTQKSKGLGLYFCQMVTDAHDSKIWVEGLEEGNTFYLSIPLANAKLDSGKNLLIQSASLNY